MMGALSRAGVGSFLDDNAIAIFGYVEAGYTYNFDKPRDGINVGRFFDFEHDEPMVSQVNLTVEKAVDASQRTWALGGRMAWIYGADAGLIHSNGLFDWYDDVRDPENQFDLFELYLDVGVPVGGGLLVRVGKFQSPLGYEAVEPTETPLYSQSYLSSFSQPATHTGVSGTYSLSEAVQLTAGLTRGWEQSLEDNNDSLEFLGQLIWNPSEEVELALGFSTGPQLDDDDDDWRTLVDCYAEYSPNGRWSFAANADLGWEGGSGRGGGTAYWYGLAGFAGYKVNDHLTISGRAEWFRDDDGTLVVGGVPATYNEATIGLTFTPFADDTWLKGLRVRPEVRADWASEDVFNDGEDDAMYTFGVDVVLGF